MLNNSQKLAYIGDFHYLCSGKTIEGGFPRNVHAQKSALPSRARHLAKNTLKNECIVVMLSLFFFLPLANLNFLPFVCVHLGNVVANAPNTNILHLQDVK